MATSTVGFIETARTLDRIGNFPTVLPDLGRELTEVLLTEEVRDAAAGMPSGVWTLAAIHLASAQIVGDMLDALITYDKRMREVAHLMGLPVLAPGQP